MEKQVIQSVGFRNIVENGDHNTLLTKLGAYAKLWNAQQELENYTKGGAQA